MMSKMNVYLDDKIKLAIWITVEILGVLISIIIIWGLIRFRSIKRLDIIKYRYPGIVSIESCLAIAFMLITMPTSLLTLSEFENLVSVQFILERIYTVTYSYLSHGIILSEAFRLWLMFYQINCGYYSDNKNWIQHINGDIVDQNWYTKNKYKYGSFRGLYKYVIGYYLCITSLLATLSMIFGYQYWITFIDGSLYAIPAITIVFLYWKCPVFADKLYFYCSYVHLSVYWFDSTE